MNFNKAYTVFPSVHRFTGDWALTNATKWAKKMLAATPDQHIRIKNEYGNTIFDSRKQSIG